MKRFLIPASIILLFLASCGLPGNGTAEDLAKTLLISIAKSDIQTVLQYTSDSSKNSIASEFDETRASGVRRGVNWDDISINKVELDDDDCIVFFESNSKMFSVKFYRIKKMGDGFVKDSSVIGNVRKVREK